MPTRVGSAGWIRHRLQEMLPLYNVAFEPLSLTDVSRVQCWAEAVDRHPPVLSYAARYCLSSHHPNPIKSSGGGWQDKQLRAAPHHSENLEERTTHLYKRIKAFQVPPSQPENTSF